MNEKFAKCIYETIVEENINTYRDLYENTEMAEKTTDYWKNAIALYRSSDDNQKKVILNIVEQTIIDTISCVFGVLDGTSTLSGGTFEFDIKINDVSTENELLDTFLEYVEKKNR